MVIRKVIAQHRRCCSNNNVGIYPGGNESRILHNAVSVFLQTGYRYAVQGGN